MRCEIEWNSLLLDEWEKKFYTIRRTPLLQCYDYARATYTQKGQKPLWGLIRIDGTEAGLVQMAEASILFKAFHAALLDMGPVWFKTENLEEKSKAFFNELNRIFPRRIGRKRRIIPNLESNKLTTQDNILAQTDFKHHAASYETYWIDVTNSLNYLRDNLKSKWRNQLNKSERQKLVFSIDYPLKTLPLFYTSYSQEYYNKGYKNIPPSQLTKFAHSFGKNFWLCHAYLKDEIIASALILIHGSSATYQIGIIYEKGRPLAPITFYYGKRLKLLKKLK